MSDEPISNRPADMTTTDTDTEEVADSSPRVFDITPDLNIAPATDEVETATPIAMPENILGVAMRPAESEQKPPEEKVKPLQPEFGPANPPAKTIGMNKTSFVQPTTDTTQVKEPASLQDAVSSIKISPETQKSSNKPTSIPEKPWEAKSDSILKPLRTYETDFAEAMARKRISKASFVIAEDKKKIEDREAEQVLSPAPVPVPTPEAIPEIPATTPVIRTDETIMTSRPQEVPRKEDYLKNARPPEDEEVRPRNPHTTRNWLLSIISLILICGGAFAGYYLYLKSPVAPAKQPPTQNQVQSTQMINSLVLSDSKATISADNRNKNSLISIIKSEISKPQDPGTIKDIMITKTFAGGVDKVPANEIVNIMEIPTPDLIERSLSSSWMLGVYAGDNDIKNPFIISTNNFFQNTFAGLIQWEKTMPDDLKEFLINTGADQDSGNVTLRGQFRDKIVKNKDVREYVAENGYIIFLYSFISNDKLVITNSEQALEEIITRLDKSAFVR
jgi:hypothetical protein